MINVYAVVKKLTGEINATGESQTDKKRYENLEQVIDLIDKLVFDIEQASISKNNYQSSMKKIGIKAQIFLNDLKDSIEKEEITD